MLSILSTLLYIIFMKEKIHVKLTVHKYKVNDWPFWCFEREELFLRKKCLPFYLKELQRNADLYGAITNGYLEYKDTVSI